MKISLAQTRSVKGDIAQNIIHHRKFIELAVAEKADLIIFPELSITGYDPTIAKELAVTKDDTGLNGFQEISNNKKMIIGIGIPAKQSNGICISLLLFHPFTERVIYSKKHLHRDEEPFFVSGENFPVLKVNSTLIGLAICYELSVPEHSENAFKNKADIYIASVAKTAEGAQKAYQSLSMIAQKYSMQALMVNSIGPSDNFIGAGQSAVWNNKGQLLDKLDDKNEGILTFDTDTNTVRVQIIPEQISA